MLVTDGVDVPQAAAVKKARIDGNAARDVELRTQVRLSLYQQGRREANKCGPPRTEVPTDTFSASAQMGTLEQLDEAPEYDMVRSKLDVSDVRDVTT